MKTGKCLSLFMSAMLLMTAVSAFPAAADEDAKDYLDGIHVVWLGGDYLAAEGGDLAAQIAEQENESYFVDAEEGAPMAGTEELSYVTRVQEVDQYLDDEVKNLLIVELNSADLENGTAIGEWDYVYDVAYDTNTIAGALDSIMQTARNLEMTAAVVIPADLDTASLQMIELAQDMQQKWGYAIVDLRGIDPEEAAGATIAQLSPWLSVMRGNYKNMFKYAGNLPQFDPENYPTLDSTLAGLNIIQLGSSVTEGTGTDEGISFVEYIAQMTGSTYVKEAEPGTTMSNYAPLGDTSYIYRMEHNIDPEIHADLFLCQLSTNDASKRVEVGEISASDDPADFDLETVAGATEYIIHYVQDTWNCPIMFYTGTEYSNAAYGDMVEMLLALQEKYEIGIIDMYHNLSTDIPLYPQYMSPDGIHPTKRGYSQWWAPYMIGQMEEYLGAQTTEAGSDDLEKENTEKAADIAEEATLMEEGQGASVVSGTMITISHDTGDVTVEYYTGDEILETEEEGNLLVQVPEGTDLEDIRIYASEGEIDIYGVIADNYDLETVGGDMNIYLPEDQAFHVQLVTISDIFESDFLYDVGMERHEYFFGEDGVNIEMETIIGAARIMILQ